MTLRSPGMEPRSVVVGIVLYAPDDRLLPRLALVASAGFDLFIYDNTPQDSRVRIACEALPQTHYLSSGRNAGLGVGIACLCARAFEHGADALLFFDQDTIFDASTLAHVRAYHAARPDIAGTHSVVVFKARPAGVSMDDPFATHDVRFAISSGSLFFLPNAKRIGWHNASYFVDCVDYEFCLNSSNHGLRIAESATAPGLDHESEQADLTYMVLGRRMRLRRYASSRITDTVQASLRILVTAARHGNGPYVYAISKSLVGYAWFQVLCRLLPRAGARYDT